MREQMERLLRDIDLPCLSLGVLPATAEVDLVPMPGFNMYDGDRAHYELVSAAVDVTDPDELALHEKAFNTLRDAACHGDAAKELIRKALTFWSGGRTTSF